MIILAVLIVLIAIIGYVSVEVSIKRGQYDSNDKSLPTYIKTEYENSVIADMQLKIKDLQNKNPPKEVSITSFDGLKLFGYEYQSNTDLWAICVHGYTANHTYVEDIGYHYFENGYNVLTPDLRTHGKSEGRYISMGYFDSQDIILWCQYILSKNANAKIVLHGESMGAATVMMAAANKNCPSNVFATIEDSGYTNANTMMAEQLKERYKLPKFPIINLLNISVKIRSKYYLTDASPIDLLKNTNIPILFIHGDRDNFVKPYMQNQLFESYNGPKQKLTVKDAYHVASRNIDKDTYYKTVFNFLDTYKKPTF